MYKQAWKKMLEAKHILLVSHVHPDGDTLGSVSGLYDVLKKQKKKVTAYNDAKVLPQIYDFLPHFSSIKCNMPEDVDLVVCCDCGSFDRLKIARSNYEIINIDHHATNTMFGDINVVNDTFSSAGMVVYELLITNRVSITKECATALYTAVAEDTGFFLYGNINAMTFFVASKLVSFGANPKEIAQKLKQRESLAKIRLHGYMLNHFELHAQGQIASIVIDKNFLSATGANIADTKNSVSMLRNMACVKVAFMLLEKEDGYKVSMRSKDAFDISTIAFSFGGGGHKNASGFECEGLDASILKAMIIKKIKKVIE